MTRMNKPEVIEAEVERRCIDYLLHFTRLENLPGIVKEGILSRAELEARQLSAIFSSGTRRDEENKAISVSISRIYERMFKRKEKGLEHASWVILLIDRSVLWTHTCRFYCESASKRWMQKLAARGLLGGPEAFFRMFEDSTDGKGFSHRREYHIPDYQPTFAGAEVQVFDPIHPGLILGAWVERDDMVEHVRAHLTQLPYGACEVRVGPFFKECPFGNRRIQARQEMAEIYDEFSVDEDGDDAYLGDGVYVTSHGRLRGLGK